MRPVTSNVLPASFSPNEHHIIIGRGREVKTHIGNVKFDRMINGIADEYSAASCKAKKGAILSRLIEEIYDAASDGGFIKRDLTSGRWVTVEESLARASAAQALRNHLSSSYRSSRQFKQKRRLEQIQQGHKKELAENSGHAYNTTTCLPATLACVSPANSADDDDSDTNSADCDSMTFAVLESAFGRDFDIRGDDPFTPRPIAISSLPRKAMPVPIADLPKHFASIFSLSLLDQISLRGAGSSEQFFRPIVSMSV